MNTALITALEGAIERIQKLPDAAAQLGDKDYWGSVGILALTGILVVFLILAVLIFFFWLIGMIFKGIDKAKSEKEASVEAAAEVSSGTDDEEELIAVISAAIAAYEDSGDFTIKSVRKRGADIPKVRSAWSMAGLKGSMRQF